MTIINNTHYRTEHLRAFLTRIAQDELSPEKRKTARITFRYSRNRGAWCSGFAYYGGRNAIIRLNKHTPNKIDLAHVIAHEFAHLRGVHHRSMSGNPHYYRMPRTAEIYAWANELPLEVKDVKRKAQPQADAKLDHAQAMLKRAETRAKRAMTIVKKWKVKVRYYERKIAAAGIPKSGEPAPAQVELMGR